MNSAATTLGKGSDYTLNPERVCLKANPFRVEYIFLAAYPGFELAVHYHDILYRSLS